MCHLEFRACQFYLLIRLFIFSSANAISDGDKESECDEDGPSPEDSRKVNELILKQKRNKA